MLAITDGRQPGSYRARRSGAVAAFLAVADEWQQ